MIKFDFSTYTSALLDEIKAGKCEAKIPLVKEFLNNSDWTGWYHLEKLFSISLVDEINQTAKFIRDNCNVFLVIGIGGSYAGAFAAIEALSSYFYNNQKKPQIYFLGTSFSSDYYNDLVNMLKDKNVIVNVISKSGSTLETTVTFNLIKSLMATKYDQDEMQKRIIITTDAQNGHLRKEVLTNHYKSFVLPSDIGGRYSVFSPVGLLPMAVANINIDDLYDGARKANADLTNQIKYAMIRKSMYDKGKTVEAYVVYEPKLYALTEWLKQLYAESLGKQNKGILPISFINSRDLHSLGQFVQQGNKILFETVIRIKNSQNDVMVSEYNKSLNEINYLTSTATSMAHYKGKVLNNIIELDELNARNLGYLMQFFMLSCAISGYIEDVNPFDQEGVGEYKRIISDLLK